MHRALARTALLAFSLVFAGCGGGESGTEPPPESVLSVQAEAYLNEAINIMQRHSINRYEIDWPSFRRRVLAEAGTARSPTDTYDAIRSSPTTPTPTTRSGSLSGSWETDTPSFDRPRVSPSLPRSPARPPAPPG